MKPEPSELGGRPPHRGRTVLVLLGLTCLMMWWRSGDPRMAAGLCVVLPLLGAELAHQARWVAKVIVWFATTGLPPGERRALRQDWLTLLDIPSETPDPINFAIDAITGIPALYWISWWGASIEYFGDEERRSPGQTVKVGLGVSLPTLLTIVSIRRAAPAAWNWWLLLPLIGPAWSSWYVARYRVPHHPFDSRRVLLATLFPVCVLGITFLYPNGEKLTDILLFAAIAGLLLVLVRLVYAATLGVLMPCPFLAIPSALGFLAAAFISGESGRLLYVALATIALLAFILLLSWALDRSQIVARVVPPDFDTQLRTILRGTESGDTATCSLLKRLSGFDAWRPQFYTAAIQLQRIPLDPGPVQDARAQRLLSELGQTITTLPNDTLSSFRAATLVTREYHPLGEQVLHHFSTSSNQRVATAARARLRASGRAPAK